MAAVAQTCLMLLMLCVRSIVLLELSIRRYLIDCGEGMEQGLSGHSIGLVPDPCRCFCGA